MRTLVKILVAIVSYGVALAMAFYAVNQFRDGKANTLSFAWFILVVIVICGFISTKDLPVFVAEGAGTTPIPVTLFLLFLRVAISVIAGVFIAPWKIAKALASLIPD